MLFGCYDNAGRQVGVELQAGLLKGQAAVWTYAEDLDDFVVAAGDQQMMPVSCDHEVSRMAGCACIACLLQCAVLKDLEYGYAVVVKSVGCVEPFAGRVDVDVGASAGVDLIGQDLLDQAECRHPVLLGNLIDKHLPGKFGDAVHDLSVRAEFHMPRAAAGRAWDVADVTHFDPIGMCKPGSIA